MLALLHPRDLVGEGHIHYVCYNCLVYWDRPMWRKNDPMGELTQRDHVSCCCHCGSPSNRHYTAGRGNPGDSLINGVNCHIGYVYGDALTTQRAHQG